MGLVAGHFVHELLVLILVDFEDERTDIAAVLALVDLAGVAAEVEDHPPAEAHWAEEHSHAISRASKLIGFMLASVQAQAFITPPR